MAIGDKVFDKVWLSIWGVKPASTPRARNASASAVLRELTIHVESANARRSAISLVAVSAETPKPHGVRLHRKYFEYGVRGGGCKVVVVRYCQIEIIVDQQIESLERFVLADRHLDARM